MLRLVGLLALGGCAFGTRFGGVAPVGHGHGDAGAAIDLTWGGDHRGENVRTGIAFQTGVHGAGNHDYVPLGIETNMDVGVTKPNGDGFRWMAVGAFDLGLESAMKDEMAMSAPGGAYAQAFVGFGYGTMRPSDEQDAFLAGHLAFGVLARGVQLGDDRFFMLGAAFSISQSYDDRKVLASLRDDN
jgi:hypothetical protein